MSPWSPTPGKPQDCEAWWLRRKNRYEATGEPGLTERPAKHCGKLVNQLLYRDDDGVLIAVITHYPQMIIPFKMKGEVDLVVDPAHRRKGLGMMLIKEASKRWDIQAKAQRYTPASAALTNAYLEERRAQRTD